MEQQPSKATLGDVLNAFLDIYNTPDPGVQLFVLFVLVFIGIPTVGGVLILLYNNFIACEKRPTRAFSWIPFIGTSLFYHQDPLQFLQQQAKIVGPIITVDSLKEEFVYFLEPDMLGELAQSQDVSHARYIEMRMDKLYQKGYNYSEFQLAFETFWTSSSFEANKLAIADAMEDLVMKASESPEKELFQLSADMSTAAFIILCFGEEFYKQNGEKMQKVLIACEYHMNLSINVFLRGMGVPSFLSFNSSSAADKMKAWTTEELAKDQVETHYLGYLKKNIPLASHDFICSHVCHVIIGLYTSPGYLILFSRSRCLDYVSFANPSA